MTDSLTIDDFVDKMATTAEADTYHLARGNALWTGSNTVKSQALQRAWDWLRGLDWIDGIFDGLDDLPDDVKNGQIVAALEELKSQGCLNPVLTPDDYLAEKNLAGAIIKKYRPNAPVKKRFLAIDSLLRLYLKNSASGLSAGVQLERG